MPPYPIDVYKKKPTHLPESCAVTSPFLLTDCTFIATPEAVHTESDTLILIPPALPNCHIF